MSKVTSAEVEALREEFKRRNPGSAVDIIIIKAMLYGVQMGISEVSIETVRSEVNDIVDISRTGKRTRFVKD